MRRNIKASVLTVLLLCAAVIIAACSANKVESNDVEPNGFSNVDITADFTDPNFLAAVYEKIEKAAPAPIYSTDVAEIQYLNVVGKRIKSLAGLEHFVSLKHLDCNNNQLSSLPELPSGLKYLFCNDNQLTTLPKPPSGLVFLFCSYNQLTTLPELPSDLTILFCNDNQLSSLPELPSGLTDLYCSNNQLTTLPKLPFGLEGLDCSNNQITTLPKLPPGLKRSIIT